MDELWNDTPDNNTSSGEECHHKYTAVKTGEPDYENYGYIVYRCTLCGNEKTEYTYKLVDNSYFPLKVYNDRVIQGRSNWLFYSGDNSINYYAGDNVLTENTMAEWLETMQRLQDICDEKNIELLYMIMPNKEQVYGEYMPTVNMVDTYKREPRFVDYVREHSDILIVYPIDELTAAKKQWQVYHKYDTHWNSAGGFIGTQVILKALGKPVTNLSSVSVNKCESTYIDLITIGDLDRSLYNSDTDYEIEYKPEINTILEEGEGENVRHFITDSPNKQSLVLIGDSFRNQMIRYISRDFEESTFAHRNDICDEKAREGLKNADVLVVSTVERNDSVMIENLNAIIEILSE